MEIFHVSATSPYATNTFLLLGNAGHAVVVDPAAEACEYEKLLAEHSAKLTHILLTHGHHDHVGAVRALRKKTGAEVWLGADDRMGNRLFPLTDADCDHAYTDGELITVDDMTLRVITTPGHSRGSVCLLCGDTLFSGDTLFAGDIGRCDLDGGSMPDMLHSLAKLKGTVTGNPQVLPGHEGFSDMEYEKESNRYLKHAECGAL
ncbi:MAG: MBL fold metallo-hydrolase [Ruthenibacterium sp.]